MFFQIKDIVVIEVDVYRLELFEYIKEVLFQTDLLHSLEEELNDNSILQLEISKHNVKS